MAASAAECLSAAVSVSAMDKAFVRLPDAGTGAPIDGGSRRQIAVAALLLRSIRPRNGEVEILLHEMARRLEELAELATGAALDRARFDA